MIIFGFGKVTKKVIGNLIEKSCQYCNQTSLWQLCLIRTWFTLFFIPVIPYGRRYAVVCPRCGSYMALSKEQFEEMKASIQGSQGEDFSKSGASISDDIKYAGKTPTQIAYIKQMEAYKNEQNQKEQDQKE